MLEEYTLMVRFNSPVMTAEEYLHFSKNILLELAAFDDCFKNMHGWGTSPKAWSGFSSDMSDFDEIVLNQIEDRQIRYENPDPDNWELTSESKCFSGYSNSYSNTKKISDGRITITISAGGSSENNRTGIFNIEFPEYNFLQFEKSDFINHLIKKCIEIINDTFYAVVINYDFGQKVKKEKDKFLIGWQTYLSKPEIFDLLPDDIRKESFHNGTLFSISDEIIYSDNDSAVAKAIEIRDLLDFLLT